LLFVEVAEVELAAVEVLSVLETTGALETALALELTSGDERELM